MRRPSASCPHRRGPAGSRAAPPAANLDPRIEQLPSTTFFGRRLTRRQIAAIQETVAYLPRLSRTELGHTICEHLHWHTPRGRNRIQLDRLVRQARFLLLPWVRVKCLASKALALSLRQLADDWRRAHGVRPVLVETYVDPQRRQGTCYRASNWRYLGQTQARGAWGGAPAKTPKAVFVYPLQRDWQAVLLGPPRSPRSARRREHPGT